MLGSKPAPMMLPAFVRTSEIRRVVLNQAYEVTAVPGVPAKRGSTMTGDTLSFERAWVVGEYIGGGGFGQVWAVTSGDERGAAKFIPKAPGADRELLFVKVQAPNVMPIIDHGEHGDHWVLVMPRAAMSLRDQLRENDSPSIEEALGVLTDVAEALAGLADANEPIVHRDLKPDNLLLLNGTWHIADFGISRYAAATTAPDTQKFSMTPPYAAPEQWRHDRATPATDVYAFGVIAYELFAGRLPFAGPDFRDQHLHVEPPGLTGLPAALESLVLECLLKPAEARPRPANLVARLLSASKRASSSAGLAQLSQANRDQVQRASVAAAKAEVAKTAAERRQELYKAAEAIWGRILGEVAAALKDAAPAAAVAARHGGLTCTLGSATIAFAGPRPARMQSGMPFDVVAAATIDLSTSREDMDRSHSCWFGDVQIEGDYAWFEVSFMTMALMSQRRIAEPFALDPGPEAVRAVGPGVADLQLARPFTRLEVGSLDGFIDLWASRLAQAANGTFQYASSLPEGSIVGNHR
jgi:eukaryotic-like serine/threonine-protein kinase